MWTPAAGCEAGRPTPVGGARGVVGMNVEAVIGLVVGLALLVYLFYALLYPEKL